MTPALIDRDLNDLKAQGIGGVFIHPRPGLITPYLSDEWLSMVRYAVSAGKKLGMKVWIYDENSYPSGFAGGIVPAKMPDAKRAGLRMITHGLAHLPLRGEAVPRTEDRTPPASRTSRRQPGANAVRPRRSYRVFHVVYEQAAAVAWRVHVRGYHASGSDEGIHQRHHGRVRESDRRRVREGRARRASRTKPKCAPRGSMTNPVVQLHPRDVRPLPAASTATTSRPHLAVAV